MKPLSPRARAWVIGAILFLLAFDLAFFFQRVSGAYQSEFGGHPDEAAHYVTGLMIRDYIAARCPGSPMKFAEDYYTHYPKIGLGVWPPVFYLVQAAWTLPFGVTRASVLLLMALLAAIVAALIFRALREEFGAVAATFGGALFLSLPLVREYYSMVMAETLCAVFMFAAALAFGRFLDREKRADALWFGLLAALAILTKGTGMALALMAPLALAFSGKWHLLRRPALWSGALITAVVAGPWTWKFRNEGRLKGGWLQPDPSWSFTRDAAPYYAQKFLLALGILVMALAVIGVLFVFVTRRRESDAAASSRGTWSAAAALIISIFVLQIILPVGLEARHLIPALPAAILFATAALASICDRAKLRPTLQGAAFAAVFGVTVLLLQPTAKRKDYTGFRASAQAILEVSANPQDRILISSDGSGEGMFISELAMAEKRPGHTVERSSKLLAKMSWSGAESAALFSDENELHDFLAKSGLSFIVVDRSMPEAKRGPHHDLLRRVCESDPMLFSPFAKAPVSRGGTIESPPLQIYRLRSKK